MQESLTLVFAWSPAIKWSTNIPRRKRLLQCRRWFFGHLFCVWDNLSVDVVGDLFDEWECDFFDRLGLKWWEGAEDFGWTILALASRMRVLQKGRYLGEFKISFLNITSWATMQRIFKCTPYAKRKSHNLNTSGSGGVQAHSVNTLAKP